MVFDEWRKLDTARIPIFDEKEDSTFRLDLFDFRVGKSRERGEAALSRELP